jgi:hypothetical protein
MSNLEGISQHLDQQHGIQIPPGGKGTCPYCLHGTFAIRRDDTIGKCFHLACGRFITQGSLSEGYAGDLYPILDRLRETCHAHLLERKTQGYAYDYFTRVRGVHPRVVHDLAELGAVPPSPAVHEAFKPAFVSLDAAEAELKAKIDESQQRRLKEKEQRPGDHRAGQQKPEPKAKDRTESEKQWQEALQRIRDARQLLEEQQEILCERFSQCSDWLAFFHTDHYHRVQSIRFRDPGQKRFRSYTPYRSRGLFGHGLFSPYASPRQQHCNKLLIVEGEINLLQIHSLAARTAPPADHNGQAGAAYANWVAATGSSSGVDVDTVQALLRVPGAVWPPILVRDHDQTGQALADELSQALSLEVVTPPTSGQDIDDFIRAFGTDYRRAADGFAALLADRNLILRPFTAPAAEIYAIRQKHGRNDHRREFEIHCQVKAVVLADLHERGKFYHDNRRGYYFRTETKELIALDDADKELSCLLDCYGLNATEKVFGFVKEDLHVQALNHGKPTQIHRLCWFDKDTLTQYLFNHASGVYRITADTIELVDNGTDGVLFLRDRRNEPFELVSEEDLGDLFHEIVTAKINFDLEESRLSLEELQLVFDLWFLSTFFGPLLPTRPLLAFIGPKGSGKSHTLRKVGMLLFGPRFEVKNLPDKEDSFDAITTNSHFAAFDNADSHVKWLPDRLAICATGGTVSKRVLYTTNTLVNYPIDCFVGITSRTPHFRRDDVADRLLVNQVTRFGDGEFLGEQVLLNEVLSKRYRILTAVVRGLQEAIGALRDTAGRQYRTGFRMADFATFCLRLADAKGGRETMEGILARMGQAQATFTLEGDSLVEMLHLWLDTPANHGRQVDAKTLHQELAKVATQNQKEFGYPSGRSLGQRLRNVVPNLQTYFDVDVDTDTHRKQKLYGFRPLSAGKAERPDSLTRSDSAEASV